MSKKTKKVVINKCYGGFGLSNEAYEELIKMGIPCEKYDVEKDKKGEYKNKKVILTHDFSSHEYFDEWTRYNREDPLLIAVVEKLGERANGIAAKLEIIEIPADVDYEIEEYDGVEWVSEKHRTWG
ncbi:MAG: hypothetical protein ACTSUF_04350 [Candidatus Heimdallarchaeaceae archaeon]